jgi:uncharacterized protein YjbI with pentapeptide repeats
MPDKFHNANLRGFNFKGRDLTEADFTGADIRGTDFTNAVLIGVNFQNAKTGLSKNWTVVLGLAIFFLTFLAGLIVGYGSCLIANLIGDGKTGETLIFSIVFFIILIANLAVIYLRGIGVTLAILAETIGGGLIVAIAFFPSDEKGGLLAVGAQFTALALVGTISGIANMSIAVAIERSLMWRGALIFTSITALLGIIFGVILGGANDTSYIVSSLIAITVIASGTYVGSQAIQGNRKYALIQSIAIAAISKGGTKFRRANLTDADFTAANLKSADFRQANLTRTNWHLAKQLEQARCDRTYLEDPQIRQLAITKDGQGKHFEHLDLSGLNLKDANLKDAFFIGADLSEATLENANLTGARLVKTQLYQANLSGTRLTGAYIENWGISTQTNLDNVQCDYIFMQLPTDADPDPCRKPDNKKENFKEGDFADFIAPIIKTLDLYHTQNLDLREVGIKFKTLDLFHYEGIDPSAAAIAIKQLIEQHPEAELEVISLEGRGNEKIRLQAKVAGDTNRSELNAEYFAKYQQIKSLPYSDMQSLLTGIEEKDERIRGLEKLLENAISQPKFYVETYHNQGEFIMAQENKGNVNISGVQGNISGIAAAGENQTMTGVALGAISGNVTNTISQLPDSTDPNEPSLKELLTQLQALIESESELNEEDKVEALEQVKVLAESGQKPEDSTLQKLAKTAVKILKGTIASLPDVTKLVESGAKLLPYITKLLGLP